MMKPRDHSENSLPPRPLTLAELELVHQAHVPWDETRIPGLSQPPRWGLAALLTLVAMLCSALGFGAVWLVGGASVSHALELSQHERSERPAFEPLPSVPALREARAVREAAIPEPVVVKSAPAPEWTPAPPGYIEAQVDAVTAREFERKYAPR